MTCEFNDDQWEPCPAGEVSGLVESLRERRRRQRLQKVGVAVCGLAILGLTALYAVPHPLLVEPRFGGIACSDVERLADEYITGKLDVATQAHIEQHLQECDHCREIVVERRERSVAGTQGGAWPTPPAIKQPTATLFAYSGP